MIAENRIQGFANNFWKHASSTEGVMLIEDVFIDWADNSDMTINEFGNVWAKINDDIKTKYGLKKADISFSRTEDIVELADKLRNTDLEDVGTDIPPSMGEEAITPEPELDALTEEPLRSTDENPTPGLPPKGDMGELGGESGGEPGGEPELKLTESLLL